MSLVLQMPRGNLETISPRPLVLAVVREQIARGAYGQAFAACRSHRVDLNVFVEQDQEAFVRGIPDFVEQVQDVDFINLFLTSVGCVAFLGDRLGCCSDGESGRGRCRRSSFRRYATPFVSSWRRRTSRSMSMPS